MLFNFNAAHLQRLEIRTHLIDIKRDFGAFYKKFFEELDGDEAFKALNRGKSPSECEYGFFPAERIFAWAFRNYHDQHCVGLLLAMAAMVISMMMPVVVHMMLVPPPSQDRGRCGVSPQMGV